MLVYINDILVITKRSYEKNLQVVKKVLIKLKEAGIWFNIDTSYFAKSSIDYLGYVISREGMNIQPSKVHIIVDMPRLKTVTQVK